MKNKNILAILLALAMVPTTYVGAVGVETNTLINVGNGAKSTSTSSSSVRASDAELYGGVNTYDSTNLEVNADGISITASTQVNSYADLEVFGENTTKRNSDVSKVVASSEGDEEAKVVVVYKHRGRLFGFIPVTIKSVTSVEAEADNTLTVNSGLVWWGFLVAKENYSKADIESRIESNSTVKANMTLDASASAKAKVMEAVISELRLNAMASASGSVS